MKRKVLAILIPALFVAGAANAAEIYNKNGNKLDLYGKVDARHLFSDNAGDDGDATFTRLGFKGETQIGDLLTGYGQWEYEFKGNNSEANGTKGNKTRLAFAGLKFGNYGSFDYGRNYGVVYDVESWTDMLPVFGGDSYTRTDNFMVQRASGVATWRSGDFFGLVEGLNIALQYQGTNEDSDSLFGQEGTNNGHGLKKQNGDGFGMSATYDFGMGLSAGAAFAASDRTNKQQYGTIAGGENAEVWTVGLKYDANDFYLAAMYAETRNMTPFGDSESYYANKTRNLEVTAQYQFDFGLRPSLGYVQSRGRDLAANLPSWYNRYDSQDLVKYVSVGTYYYFNKNFSTYIDYKINLLDEDDSFYKAVGISTDDVVGIGMVYQF
ncbi:porin OmpC [Intestinirhabdus alba]|jgi:outer membrane protein N|uniref:Porin OmpC n=1 Tax=Intestinirhabdus alba TaxID=2899544 RepID=A0A6L6IQR4_9ENTR|nr:porin OmpC [Intestinirhabdus alba]MTH48048.1 porin OmpC [Intestinirhabdus alba]